MLAKAENIIRRCRKNNIEILRQVRQNFQNVELVKNNVNEVQKRELWNRSATTVHQLLHKQPGAKMSEGTWWSALNAVTYYADHIAGRDRNAALRSAWFGSKATMKRKALDLATEYAKAA